MLLVVVKVFQSYFAYDSLRFDYPFMWSLKLKCMIKVVDVISGRDSVRYKFLHFHLKSPMNFMTHFPSSHPRVNPMVFKSFLYIAQFYLHQQKMYSFEKCCDNFAPPIQHLLLPPKRQECKLSYICLFYMLKNCSS